jgi:two-component system, sensor histidine kinase and response regulator
MESQSLILIVDDEPDNFDVIEILLFREGYNLQYVANGSAAIAFLQQTKPDVILLDVMMPDIDGIELCRQLKSNPDWQHIPIVMVTALNSKDDLARCLEAGADDFVCKPVNGVELRARVRSMLRIKQQYDALEQLVAFREDMCHMVVHDLRNPLAVILTACQLLHLYQPPQQYLPKIQQIEDAGSKLQELIDSILWLAKSKVGKLEIHTARVDPIALGKSAIADFQTLAAQRQIELIGEFPETTRAMALDPNLIRRVVDNLLSNAIKFSPKASQVNLKIDYPTQTQLRLQVCDRGIGISEVIQRSLFQKYVTGFNVPDVPQMGLGLAFCKLAIDAHGGEISVQSQEMAGSTFTVILNGIA